MKHIKGLKRYAVSIVITFIIILVNIGVFYNFYTDTYYNLGEQTKSYLNNIVEEAAECVNIKINERFITLEALAMYVGTYSNGDYTTVSKVLDAQVAIDGFGGYDIVGLDGSGLSEKGSIDYSNTDFFDKTKKGKNMLFDYNDQNSKSRDVGFSVPIYRDEQIEGVLVVFCSYEEFSSFTDIDAFGNNGDSFIVKQDGTLLTRANGLDEVENIKLILSDDTKSANALISGMKQKTLGNVSYGNGNHKRYLCYSKTSYNKWYVVTIVSADTVDEHTSVIRGAGVTFIVEISVLLILLLVYFIYLITSHIRNSRINKERYYIVTDNSETIMFDYSVKNDTMYCNDKWNHIFGYELPKSDMKSIMTKYVYEEDIDKFLRRIDRINKTNDYVKFSIRLLNDKNEPIGCLVKLYAIRGFRGKITKILGVIETLVNDEQNTKKEQE